MPNLYYQGYYRRNGTYVQPHYQTRPDGNIYRHSEALHLHADLSELQLSVLRLPATPLLKRRTNGVAHVGKTLRNVVYGIAGGWLRTVERNADVC